MKRVRSKETANGLAGPAAYEEFSRRVDEARRTLREFLDAAKTTDRIVAGYGAAAKASTLLNSVDASREDLAYVVDRSPHKQGRYLPGSHLPVYAPEMVEKTRPDVLLVLAWNLLDEVMQQMEHVRTWGCRFAIPIPSARVLP